MESIDKRLEVIYTNFHPLSHFTATDVGMSNKIASLNQTIASALYKAPSYLKDIKERAELALPLLKKIEKSLKQFRSSVKLVLSEASNFKDKEKLKEELEFTKKQLLRFPKLGEPHPKLQLMGDKLTVFTECQIELEALFDPIVKMCLLIKNKGKKLLKDYSREDYRDLLTYVDLLVKSDFLCKYLPDLHNVEDLVNAAMHIQSQKSLYKELKKQQPYSSELETIRNVEPEELKRCIRRWKDLKNDIEELEGNEEFKVSFQSFLTNGNVPISDLKNCQAKLFKFKKELAHYFRVSAWFKKLRFSVAKFCLEEFDMRVELTWEG